MKHGQLSLFLILVLVMVLAGMLLWVNQRATVERSPATTIPQFQQFVEQCLQHVAEEGIYRLSAQGGFFSGAESKQYTETGTAENPFAVYYYANMRLPYLWNGSASRLRPLSEIEEALARYVAVELDSCIDKLPNVPKKGKGPEVQVTVGREQTQVRVRWPLTVEQKEAALTREVFSATVPLRFGLVYALAEQFLTGLGPDPYQADSSCTTFQNLGINLYVEGNPYTVEYVVRIIDPTPLTQGKTPLRFQFAIKNSEVIGECA